MSRFIKIYCTCLLTLVGGVAFAQHSESLEVDIPAQAVGDVLNVFAEQSGLQVVMYAADAEGQETEAVVGEFENAEAVLDTLLAGTGLEFAFINDRTVAVNAVVEEEERGDSDSKNLSPRQVRRRHKTSYKRFRKISEAVRMKISSSSYRVTTQPALMKETVQVLTCEGLGPVAH